MNPFPYWVRVHDPVRRESWRRAFGGEQVPVMSPVAILEQLPGHREPKAVYMLDLDYLTRRSRATVATELAELFGLTAREVDEQLDTVGVPLLAEHCTLSIRDPMEMELHA